MDIKRYTADFAGQETPVIELAGDGPGPRLSVIAGVHGCEYASMAGVRRWVAGLAGRSLRGTVKVVPVVNLPAFRARSPFVVPEDGKNLNRCFPGSPTGTLAERLAFAVFEQVIAGSDALVDTHAGDLIEALEPFALYDGGPAEEVARGMATGYGLGYVLRQAPGTGAPIAGTSSAAAAAAGVPAITAEAGGCGLVEQAAVAAHVRGLDGVLRYLGMSDDPAPPSPAPVYLDSFIWPRTPSAGWWEPSVRVGETVRAGQVLGTVSTLDGGAVLETFSSPADGVVLFLTSSPAVAADGLLLGLGAA
ncbi:MAG TPA: succinylglutamate desuccinylase/aspartoacylase family protein [Trebonia sp.]|nr:succinylglutamate desuccinylase/aspartoacylase family protein [Trebonia sp.]